jgi:hypothetical protein
MLSGQPDTPLTQWATDSGLRTCQDRIVSEPAFEQVRVVRNDIGPLPGIRKGNYLAYEFEVAPKWFFTGPKPDGPVRQRSFVMLEEEIQLCQPVVNRDVHEGWWYVDLVQVEDRSSEVSVTDDFIDVMVPPAGHPYRVLDLDEYADAMVGGRVSPARLAMGLRKFQRFLDLHLNRRHDALLEWPEFPPLEIDLLRTVPIDDPHGWAANTLTR